MSKFTFYNHDKEGTLSATTFEVDSWVEALDRFVRFLRGAGYQIQNNSVGVNTSVHSCADHFDVGNIMFFEQNED